MQAVDYGLKPLLPGATIGILGSGQLGRMLAMAGQAMGYRFVVFGPELDAPAHSVCHQTIVASYNDRAALQRFAQQVHVVTVEFENIPVDTLEILAQQVRVAPSPFVLQTTQHRLREKTWLAEQGFPLVPFYAIQSAEDLVRAAYQLGVPFVLKTAGFGYDGKGQAKCHSLAEAQTAWQHLDHQPCVAEAFMDLAMELSVIVARSTTGEVACFGPIENVHCHHVLHQSIVPARIDAPLAQQAVTLATQIATQLDGVGLLCVELFVTKQSQLLVNELAPRPHNSGHYSMDACTVSQFEQHIRAICGLPLGDTTPREPAVMTNLLGDLWATGEPDWVRLFECNPQTKLHLYGKTQARPGRKMGHYTLMGTQQTEVFQQAGALFNQLNAPLVATQ